MGIVTDTRFLIGVAVGAGAVMFVIPWLRGVMASRQAKQ
jgi:hypothetical protein